MQYRFYFLVDDLYNILVWKKKCRVLKSVTYDVHTHKHTRMGQNKQGREFPILMPMIQLHKS